ncbi:deoxynucleoside kinase [Rhizobacter sp. J219]|uniref:deoxynucleoside kinase n=1 Tax=Rhizobacter sp. J219 TaxID=2898430 RepID=UPI002151ACEE|nr:deoxynucleoside kinase [Rhizobacter sp. J219]MCR5881394.1 deoxynucleoside kinase [Rhizobacter sp. J219]
MAAHLRAELMLERADENPYLERFYADVPGYAFQTQVFFLFQRMRQVRELAQPGLLAPAVVSDFMLAKDALFARMNLSDEEYHLYQQMYAQVSAQLPQPDLVIWLQATPPTLIQRIKQRGIAMEQRIAPEYLQKLCDAYADYFQSFDGAPLMVVNSENFNPIAEESDFQMFLESLRDLRGSRVVFDLRSCAARDESKIKG